MIIKVYKCTHDLFSSDYCNPLSKLKGCFFKIDRWKTFQHCYDMGLIFLFIFLFIYFLFTQHFKRVTHLANIAILPSGPLLT